MKQFLSAIVFVTILTFSFDVNANLPLKTQISDNYEVIVFLKDGRTIEGVLLQRTVENILIETDFGEITIRTENIERIELKGTSEQIPPTERRETKQDKKRDSDLESEVAMIGRAMVYESRKKNIGTAIGFEALGAGLLYAESYVAGSIMLLAQTGLLAGAIFADDPDVQLGLGIGALALKGTNLFLTIRAVNRYNQNLMYEWGLQDRPEPREPREPRIRKPYVVPSGAVYLELGGNKFFGIHGERRFDRNNLISMGIGTSDVSLGMGFMYHRIIGKNKKKLELGAGLTYHDYSTGRIGRIIFNPLIGYRKESKGRFLFRIYATTFSLSDDDGLGIIGSPTIGLSFGYSF